MPFAGYQDFAACVAANSDKQDPKAYCATIMRAVEKVNPNHPLVKHYPGLHDQADHGNWADSVVHEWTGNPARTRSLMRALVEEGKRSPHWNEGVTQEAHEFARMLNDAGPVMDRLYRGVSVRNWPKVGDVLEGPLSFTKTPGTAKEFANKGKNIPVVFEIGPGAQGIDLGRESVRGEEEVILAGKLRVTSLNTRVKPVRVGLEEIERFKWEGFPSFAPKPHESLQQLPIDIPGELSDAEILEALRGLKGAVKPTHPLVKSNDDTELYEALIDWYRLYTGVTLPTPGMTPVEAFHKADELWERIEGDGDFELEKHYGPGDHPSGSPQSDHGRKGPAGPDLESRKDRVLAEVPTDTTFPETTPEAFEARLLASGLPIKDHSWQYGGMWVQLEDGKRLVFGGPSGEMNPFEGDVAVTPRPVGRYIDNQLTAVLDIYNDPKGRALWDAIGGDLSIGFGEVTGGSGHFARMDADPDMDSSIMVETRGGKIVGPLHSASGEVIESGTKIRIDADTPRPAQAIKDTLVHEMGHALDYRTRSFAVGTEGAVLSGDELRPEHRVHYYSSLAFDDYGWVRGGSGETSGFVTEEKRPSTVERPEGVPDLDEPFAAIRQSMMWSDSLPKGQRDSWAYPAHTAHSKGNSSAIKEFYAETIRYWFKKPAVLKGLIRGVNSRNQKKWKETYSWRANPPPEPTPLDDRLLIDWVEFALRDAGVDVPITKAEGSDPDPFFTLILDPEFQWPEGMSPEELQSLIDANTIAKHYGPGSHPGTGTDQSVHGRGGTGSPVSAPEDTTTAPTSTQQGFSDRPLPPGSEPNLKPLHELRQLISDTAPAQIRVTKEQFATGDLYQEVFRGKPYMTSVGPQNYDVNTYLFIQEGKEEVGFCGICGDGVIKRKVGTKAGTDYRANLERIHGNLTARAAAQAAESGEGSMINAQEQAEKYQAAIDRFDERGYTWEHFQPGKVYSFVYGVNADSKELSWTAGERLGDKLISEKRQFHPRASIGSHENVITDGIVSAPDMDEMKKRREIHVAYDKASMDSLNAKEKLNREVDRLGKESMVEVKKVGRKVANEIDRRASGENQPNWKKGDQVFVDARSGLAFGLNGKTVTVVGPANSWMDTETGEIAETSGGHSWGRMFTVEWEAELTDLPASVLSRVDPERQKILNDITRQTGIAHAANEKAYQVYQKLRPLQQMRGTNLLVYPIPDADIKRWGKRRGYGEYMARKQSWAEYEIPESLEAPSTNKPRGYIQEYLSVDNDALDIMKAEWKAKGFTLITHNDLHQSMAWEYNGVWGVGAEREAALRKQKKLNQQLEGISFTSNGGDFTKSVVEVLGEYRDMGGSYKLRSQSAGAQMVKDVQDWLPADWIEASNSLGELSAVKSNARGEYSPHNQRIRTDDHGTVLHELGHRTEHAVAEIRFLERAFYDSRTNNASDAQVNLTSLFPGHGYKSGEVTRPDEFTHAYMGKTYNGRGSVEEAYELLSMGLSNVYFEESVTKRGAERPTGRNDKVLEGYKDHPKAMSPEFREFILGLLAVAGGK